MSADRRQIDEELRPSREGTGWACPRCRADAAVFFGSPRADDSRGRVCRACFPVVYPEWAARENRRAV